MQGVHAPMWACPHRAVIIISGAYSKHRHHCLARPGRMMIPVRRLPDDHRPVPTSGIVANRNLLHAHSGADYRPMEASSIVAENVARKQ